MKCWCGEMTLERNRLLLSLLTTVLRIRYNQPSGSRSASAQSINICPCHKVIRDEL